MAEYKDLVLAMIHLKGIEMALANTGSGVEQIQAALKDAEQNVIDAQTNLKIALIFKEATE